MNAEPPEPDATVPPSRGGRLLSRFYAPDSYGLVVLLILVTYVVSVAVEAEWGASLVVVVQVATVWFALRTSRARRSARLAADGLLVLASAVAILAPLLDTSRGTSNFVLAASVVLYLIAPLSIVRSLVMRSSVDGETFLGAIAAYLLIGMLFAFTYRLTGQLQDAPFFGSGGDGTRPRPSSSASRRSPPPGTATSCRPPTPVRRWRSARCSWDSSSWRRPSPK